MKTETFLNASRTRRKSLDACFRVTPPKNQAAAGCNERGRPKISVAKPVK